jgi:EmrB/QacA subfamily drug resistance transporter
VEQIRAGTSAARGVLAATVLGSSIAFLDGTVVNIALPAIGEHLDAGTTGLQWTIDAYLVTLTALLLLGGSLGDRYGRRRMFVVGLVAFAVSSVACGLAPSIGVLIVARAVQGIGGALLVPGSLSIIAASFHPDDRAWAIGVWSGLAGVSTAIAPFLGGWLIDAVSWRAIFFINVPVAAVAIGIAWRKVPESRDLEANGRVDLVGAACISVALGSIAFALIESAQGVGTTEAVAAIVGVVAFAGFILVERRVSDPMLPLGLFASRRFSGANLTTLAVYSGLGGATFVVVLQLQLVLGYSALEAGAALLPTSLLLLVFSARAGALSQRIGPRLPMTIGPIVAAIGLAWFSTVDAGSTYLVGVFGPAVVFGIGLVLTVSPLTATVLGAVEDRHVGIASGVNNAVARGGGLLAVAFLPTVAGLDTSGPATAFSAGYPTAMLVCAGLCAGGGLIAWASIGSGPATAVLAAPGPTIVDGPCLPMGEP